MVVAILKIYLWAVREEDLFFRGITVLNWTHKLGNEVVLNLLHIVKTEERFCKVKYHETYGRAFFHYKWLFNPLLCNVVKWSDTQDS